MSTTTTNYNFVKPDYSDIADIAVINGNMDSLDSILSGKAGTLTGTTDPSSGTGNNGDVYYKTETVDNVTSVVGVFVKLSGEWLAVSTSSAPDIEDTVFPQT